MIEHHKETREIDLAEQHSDGWHDDAFDKRGDNFSKSGADDYADSKIDDVTACNEFSEFFQHRMPPDGFESGCRRPLHRSEAALVRPRVRRRSAPSKPIKMTGYSQPFANL